jgi:hypothetical protein
MSDNEFVRVPAGTAAEVCKDCQLDAEARGLLRDDLTPPQFLHVLIERRLFRDATQFLSHALPKREGVWWALLCARERAGPSPPPATADALRAAETWVRDPSEENRLAAKPAGYATPAECTAGAAFCSGEGRQPARSVAGAVMTAAMHDSPEKAPERLQAFLARGIEVATGASHWEGPSQADPQAVAEPSQADPQAVVDEGTDRPARVLPPRRRNRWEDVEDSGALPPPPPDRATLPIRAVRWQWD